MARSPFQNSPSWRARGRLRSETEQSAKPRHEQYGSMHACRLPGGPVWKDRHVSFMLSRADALGAYRLDRSRPFGARGSLVRIGRREISGSCRRDQIPDGAMRPSCRPAAVRAALRAAATRPWPFVARADHRFRNGKRGASPLRVFPIFEQCVLNSGAIHLIEIASPLKSAFAINPI